MITRIEAITEIEATDGIVPIGGIQAIEVIEAITVIDGTRHRCGRRLDPGSVGCPGGRHGPDPPARTSDRRPVTDVLRALRAQGRGVGAPARYRADHAT
jgi:hypothetical protein